MEKVKKAFAVIIMIFSFLYLIFAPFIFLPNLNINIYTEKAKKQTGSFEGIVTLWNVSDSYSVPRTFLKFFVNNAEKNNIHFFIETESMSVKTAQERIASGERPDLISFTHGFLSDEWILSPLTPDENIIINIQNSAVLNDTIYAYPYMAAVMYPPEDSESHIADIDYYYIGAIKSDDPKKADLMQKIIKYLVSEKLQRAIIEKGYIPVCFYDKLYETEDNNTAIYESMFSEIRVPCVFGERSL